VPAVTSRQNPIVARFRAAARRDRPDRLLLDGAHLIEEALAAGIHIVEAAVAAPRADVADLAARLRRRGIAVTTVSTPVMEALSPVRSSSPIAALAELKPARASEVYRNTPMVVVAIGVQDPGNVGAIVRVAEAGGATGVVCAGAGADPYGWKALRGSMGSALRLGILVHDEGGTAVEEARRHGCRIVAAAPREGRPLFEADLRGPLAVLIGGEGPGLSAAQIDGADERIVIPMEPPVESLNVAVSAALIVYEARRQRLGAAQGDHVVTLS
jgi:TrmH family RNA methyltransferase